MPNPNPRKRKPDPNQGVIPGFNVGGSETAPSRGGSGGSTAPSGVAGASAGYSHLPPPPSNAGGAYAAANAALNPPKPMDAGNLGMTGPMDARDLGASPWKKGASTAMGMAKAKMGAGAGPLASMGKYGGAADLAVRGVKSAFAANPLTNPDTWRMQNSSDEGQGLWMGRGMDKPGLYPTQTAKKYFASGGKQESRMFPSEYKETYSDHGYGSHVPHGDTMAPGTPDDGFHAAGGLAPPGPAQDWTHQSRTYGSGGPWMDAHTAATSGINTAPVEPLRAPPTN